MKMPITPLVLALAASPAYSASDPRLRSVHYEANQVVPVQGRLGFQSMIQFAPGEEIENVAVGNSEAWQVTPNKRANLLFLKPLASKARTNMTVVTDQRVYLFDLSVGAGRGEPVYNLSFTYDAPRPAAAPPVQTRQASTAPAMTAMPVSWAAPGFAALSPSAPAPNAKLNYAWKAKGDKDLMPRKAYDDGRSLFLEWPAKTPLPALLTPGADGMEGPLTYRQVGKLIVVDQVPATVVIRLGKEQATLFNKHPAPVQTAER
jgi:type IV secretion system protein VirB9